MSALRVVNNVSPQHSRQGRPQTPLNPLNFDSPVSPPGEQFAGLALGSPPRQPMSAVVSPEPPSVFDQADEQHDDHYTEPTTTHGSGSDEPSYDLKPPPPSISHDNIEVLSTRFFSSDHLDLILRDHSLAARFSRFLKQYRPQYTETLRQYTESQKAISAVAYANALAHNINPPPGHPAYHAAELDDRFKANSRQIVEDLVDDALPAYLTHRLVQLTTDTLVKEITGNNAPIMREMIPSLAEVYCVTDPSLADNPIVYASDEFYNTTQYGREYVIGRNCRFLQGPKTSNSSVRRLIDALTEGQEICETLLNYRRDGSPFMNLLMIAPLYDNKGQVRYFLGCQIDVSPLIERGRGMESFAQLLDKDRAESRFGGRPDRSPKACLGELSQMLSGEEAEVMRNGTQKANEASQVAASSASHTGTVRSTSTSTREKRVVLGADEVMAEMPLWPHPSLGPSGRLPGVYQNYLLVRPYPSLRITFTSPALRIPGLLQTKFLDRIGGSSSVRENLLEAMSRGTGVTAKVIWLTGAHGHGKQRWIHCTPLLGSDERVGVWMIVMVENEQVTGQLNRQPPSDSGIGSPPQSAALQRIAGNKLYTDYLRRIGRPGTKATHHSSSTQRDEREAEEQFRDF